MHKVIYPGGANTHFDSYSTLKINDISGSKRHYSEKEVCELLEKIQQEYKDIYIDKGLNSKENISINSQESSLILKRKYDKNCFNNKKIIQEVNKISSIIEKAPPSGKSTTDSLHDLFNEVKQSIVVGKHDYLDILKSIFSNYMDYVKELREAISSLSQYTKAGKKDGYIAINYVKFYEGLNSVVKKYKSMREKDSFFYNRMLFSYLGDGKYHRQFNNNEIFYKNKNQVETSIKSVEKILKGIKGINITLSHFPVKLDKNALVERETSPPIKTEKLEKDKKEYPLNKEMNQRALLLPDNCDIDIECLCSIDFSDIDKLIDLFEPYLASLGVLSETKLKEKRESLVKDRALEVNRRAEIIKSKDHKGFIIPLIDIDEEMGKIIEENDNKIKNSNIYHDKLQTEFDLFKKSLDSVEKRINANMDELSKKFSSANSNYDNFIKIISSTMNTLLEMAKGFLRY
ncbi:IpaD/SipD/SspD family type III secretion system needle tip protein [Proteus vulgaris]|uniref:IpaD/SipD/SspD family type III secretion system needle tip protein n=1 Tax=Proteus vulgaris TaxID=585 RepID=UPI00254105D3|nr:IpaD/SipD/SspD family type III secretion system needle tip protein [Proteus vulgaris]WIF71910.1 IpaD/SipD/SspD family type III secretion system needle tip protein [Proteus vulgaris]